MAISKWEEVKNKLPLIEQWCRDGATDEMIYNNLRISKDTFYRYKKEHSDFSDVLKTNKDIVDAMVESALLKSALGQEVKEEVKEVNRNVVTGENRVTVKTKTKNIPGSLKAQLVWLGTRQREKWGNTKSEDTSKLLADTIQQAYEKRQGDDNANK